jgi:hypothetical protein
LLLLRERSSLVGSICMLFVDFLRLWVDDDASEGIDAPEHSLIIDCVLLLRLARCQTTNVRGKKAKNLKISYFDRLLDIILFLR